MAKKRTKSAKKNAAKPAPQRSPWTLVVLIALLVLSLYGYHYFSRPDTMLSDAQAKPGDTISVHFVGRLENGTIVTTNVEEAARDAGIYDPSGEYEPSHVTIGDPAVMIGISDALIGMRVGDMKKVTIAPQKAFGEHDPQRIVSLSRMAVNERSVSINKHIEFPKEQFEAMYGDADPDTLVLNSSDVQHVFVEEQEGAYIYELNVSLTQNITLPGTSWPSSVYIIGPTRFVLLQEVEEGRVYATSSGTLRVTDVENDRFTTQLQVNVGDFVSTKSLSGTVISTNETHMIVDANPPLAGKTLVYELKRVE